MKAQIFLNNKIRDNFAFFCPNSGLHLSLSNPIGYADRVTPAILRGLKNKTLVDVSGVIDMENKCIKEIKDHTTEKYSQNIETEELAEELVVVEEVIVEELVEELAEEEEEAVIEMKDNSSITEVKSKVKEENKKNKKTKGKVKADGK